jgi:hypothetical protein
MVTDGRLAETDPICGISKQASERQDIVQLLPGFPAPCTRRPHRSGTTANKID